MDDAASFRGNIQEHYDSGLGPVVFIDYERIEACASCSTSAGLRITRNPTHRGYLTGVSRRPA
jgi:hypothetical protein